MKTLVCFLMLIPGLLVVQNRSSKLFSDYPLQKKACATVEVNIVKEETREMKKESSTFYLEEGKYKGLWNTKATNGSVYKDLKVTAIISKVNNDTYSGALFISDNYKSCCKTIGDSGDGPITISIIDKEITFTWVDNISFCLGEFKGAGVYTDSNKIIFTNLTGKDCEGNHIGSITFIKE